MKIASFEALSLSSIKEYLKLNAVINVISYFDELKEKFAQGAWNVRYQQTNPTESWQGGSSAEPTDVLYEYYKLIRMEQTELDCGGFWMVFRPVIGTGYFPTINVSTFSQVGPAAHVREHREPTYISISPMFVTIQTRGAFDSSNWFRYATGDDRQFAKFDAIWTFDRTI